MMSSFTIARILLFTVVIVYLISAPISFQQLAKSSAADGAANDQFGYSSAISGDVALVGAYKAEVGSNSDQGAAYIFRSSDGGATWPSSETQKLTASDGASNDYFGHSSAISGDVALVGANKADNQGAAYIFRSSDGGATWPSNYTQKLTASDGASDDFFGISSAISGDVALVGANQADPNGNKNQGAAYIFRSSDGGATWPSNYTQKLTASDGDPYDNFGHSSAISGDVALVGAYKAEVGSNSAQGAAYIFRSSDGGATWPSNETQKLTASDGASNDYFGHSSAISGDVALVGAIYAKVGSNTYQGAAYIFRSSDGGATWPSSETQKLTASDGASNDYFGISTTISGGVALVGAYGGNSNKGAAYIFRSSDGGATWPSSETQKLTASDGASNDYFGRSSAISGDVALVGASGVQGNRGAAYIFGYRTVVVQSSSSREPRSTTVCVVNGRACHCS
jgi:hypothetical protein